MNKFNLNLVTLFGIGYIKFAPGTFASATVCLFTYFFITYIPHSFWFLLILFFLILFYSPFAINRTLGDFKKVGLEQMVDQEEFTYEDPKQIVVDEVLGMLIPLLLLSAAFEISHLPIFLQKITSIIWFMNTDIDVTKFFAIIYFKYFIIIYFLLFRFFDILKPFPISYVDKTFKGSFGIIFDDILAGIYCLLFPLIITIFF